MAAYISAKSTALSANPVLRRCLLSLLVLPRQLGRASPGVAVKKRTGEHM